MRPIRVDLSGLDDFAANLDGVKNQLNGTRDMLSGYDGAFGSGDVWGALEDFEGGWKDGRTKIEGNSQRLIDISRDAVKAYTDGDEEIVKSLTEGTKEQAMKSYR